MQIFCTQRRFPPTLTGGGTIPSVTAGVAVEAQGRYAARDARQALESATDSTISHRGRRTLQRRLPRSAPCSRQEAQPLGDCETRRRSTVDSTGSY